MLTIIKPDEFVLVPWKNGLGHTTELAINGGGTLDDFNWRLSIASVIIDGEFSNFSGYERNLVLIEGNGLTLDHQNGTIDNLTKLLDIARFDGGCKTLGSLSNGCIKDFNIITKKVSVVPQVQCYREHQKVSITPQKDHLYFAYSLTNEMMVKSTNTESEDIRIPTNSLLKISGHCNNVEKVQPLINLTGKNMILVALETPCT